MGRAKRFYAESFGWNIEKAPGDILSWTTCLRNPPSQVPTEKHE